MAIVTRTTLPPMVEQDIMRKLLSTPEAFRIFSMFAPKFTIPQQSGDIYRKRRYNRIETVPVPVDPAMMNPPAQLQTSVDIDVQTRFYATYVPISYQVSLINQEDVRNGITARLTQCLAETEDQLIRDMLEATAGMVNCTGGTNGDVPTEIIRSDVDGIVQTLQNNNGEFIYALQGGENKFATAPIRDSYAMLSHTNMISQFENVAGVINKAQYPNPNASNSSAEWCSIGNIRCFTSSRGSVTANASALGNDVYNNIVVAQESYSCVSLEGGDLRVIYNPPGSGDDPAHLRHSLGFRFTFGSVIDNDQWLINLRATLA